MPRRDHVVVVGLGQVGLRLCLLLRACGVPVVAVDTEAEGENVGFAKRAKLPVVIGRGANPAVLRRLSLERARCLAAVTPVDLNNIEAAMAARAADDDLRVLLRAGDGDVADETQSLEQIGHVVDVHRLGAVFIAGLVLGRAPEAVAVRDGRPHLLQDCRVGGIPAVAGPLGHASGRARIPAGAADTDLHEIVMNAAVTTRISTSIDRPQPRGADSDRASGSEFEQLWAALRDAPARETPARVDPSSAPVLVSAAAMSKAAVKINPDRVVDALMAFKRDSTLTFTNAVASSQYAADLAPRGAPAPARSAPDAPERRRGVGGARLERATSCL